MELEEMKLLWDEMSQKVEQQQLLNDKIILDMTEMKYKGKVNKVLLSESVALAINYLIALFIIFNFDKLDTLFYQISGIILILCFSSSFLSVRKVLQIRNINISKNNYQEMIISFNKKKKEFIFIQKSFGIIAIPVAILALPVFLKMVFNLTYHYGYHFWLGFIPLTCIFLYIILSLLIKEYSKISNSAEDILKEIEG